MAKRFEFIIFLKVIFNTLLLLQNLEKKDYDVPSDWIVNRLEESVLSHRCPDEFQNVQDEDVVVWVDPLDGTSEFTQGLLDHVTILIGLSVKGKAVGGVIHQPFFNHNVLFDFFCSNVFY